MNLKKCRQILNAIALLVVIIVFASNIVSANIHITDSITFALNVFVLFKHPKII